MVLCRDKGPKGSDSMAIISNNRSFIGMTDAVKISAGTDDGIMKSNPFPFDFYYNEENIRQGIRFCGDSFAYLTPNLTGEELKVNRRDAVCKGLYREDHEDYVRLVWIGYSHYTVSNQTEANRLEWEMYFFKDDNVIEIVIGKTPRTVGSIDYFDTKGEEVFNGPFEAGCSYVFKGDGTGKNFKIYLQSHYEKPQYLERDIAIVGENGKEKLIYPTTIASNTLVEQEDGTYEKLSEVLKNLKGGGDYEFLPVYPNNKPKMPTSDFLEQCRADESIESQSKRINPFIACSTENRPIVEDVGFQIYDTDTRSPMWWDGETWVAGLTIGGGRPPGEDTEEDKDFHMYRAEIHSTNGTIFRNGEIMTTLKARLYDFDRNITTELHPSQYKWSRISKDEASDIIWDNQHSEGSYEINITASDVRLRAVFYLDVVDENGLSLLSCQASTG